MTDDLLKQMANELAEIRKLLAAVLGQQHKDESLTETKAEIAMVDAMGLDPVQYLRDKARRHRAANKSTKRTRHDAPMA